MKTARARRRPDQPAVPRLSTRVKPLFSASNEVSTAPKSEDADWDQLPRIFLAFMKDINAGRQNPALPKQNQIAPPAEPGSLVDPLLLKEPLGPKEEPKAVKPRRKPAARVPKSEAKSKPTKSEIESPAELPQLSGPKIHQPVSITPTNLPNPTGLSARGMNAFGPQGMTLAQLVEYINYCHRSQVLKPEQLWALQELIAQQLTPEQLWALQDLLALGTRPPPVPAARVEVMEGGLMRSDSGEKDYPVNCMHVRACYFIWDRQSKSVVDPTELGRKYKELYFAVS